MRGSRFFLFFFLCDARWRSFSANWSQNACCRRCSRCELSCTFPSSSSLLFEEVLDCAGVHCLGRSVRQHRRRAERHRGSHVTDRDCPTLRHEILEDSRPRTSGSGSRLCPWAFVLASLHHLASRSCLAHERSRRSRRRIAAPATRSHDMARPLESTTRGHPTQHCGTNN